MIKAPYLLFIGDYDKPRFAKTAAGLVEWCPEKCGGVMRSPGNDQDFGLPVFTNMKAAVEAGLKTVVIGVAPAGGQLPESWASELVEALEAGLDIAAGLHTRLNDNDLLSEAAKKYGRQLIDIRYPSQKIPLATGKKRRGKRILAVGTDCALGKKYTALALEKAMLKKGMDAEFVATGQTGILISGKGIAIDSVVADFIAGAAEMLSPEAEHDDHWYVIEGQGSLFHPAYAGVSMGLLHGSQPDYIVLCHEAMRERISSFEDYILPSVEECLELNLTIARRTNPAAQCLGLSVNTSELSDEDAESYLKQLSVRMNMPAVDPIRFGVDDLLAGLSEGQS